jgi:hypothetical protein
MFFRRIFLTSLACMISGVLSLSGVWADDGSAALPGQGVQRNGDLKKSAVEQSDAALSNRVEAIQRELTLIQSELSKNFSARSAQSQKKINDELDALEKRLTVMRKDLEQLATSSSNDVKQGLKKNIGDALISAGALLKNLGAEVKEDKK